VEAVIASGLRYDVDGTDEITAVCDSWGPFAEENGSDDLAPENVIGRSLWDFVTDETTQQLYRDILVRVRQGRTIRFPIRCDAPDRRRVLEMRLSPRPEGAVEFRTRTLSETLRSSLPLLEIRAPRGEDMLRICGWCKQVDLDGAWAELEDALPRLRLFERERLPQLTHGICGACLEEVLQVIEGGAR
jgi:hypothetical protein